MANTKAIHFSKDGKLKIMHITDTHLGEDNINGSLLLIGKACDKECPDIVVVTGDNVENNGDRELTRLFIKKFMSVFEERNIPVAVTFGNHDSQSKDGFNRDELMAEYNKYPCSLENYYYDNRIEHGTYCVPVKSSENTDVKFCLWLFDVGNNDDKGYYSNVSADKIFWYELLSEKLKKSNNGQIVPSLAFQHTIVPEIYDSLKKTNKHKLFSFSHIYNKDEFYMFDKDAINYGTLNETPCCGKTNNGQFASFVKKNNVLAVFSGHDHTNAFGVKYKGIDIVNSLSTRYNGDRFSTQYGYRIIDIDEKKTAEYTTRVEHWYDMFNKEDIIALSEHSDRFGYKTAKEIFRLGKGRKLFEKIIRGFSKLVTGRQITYND